MSDETEDEPVRISRELVVWDEAGLASHAETGRPVTGIVVNSRHGVLIEEGRYVDGVRQGFGHTYYSRAGRKLARREAGQRVRITRRYHRGSLLEERAHAPDGALTWSERWDEDGSPLPTPEPPPLRDSLTSPDTVTALAARRTVLADGERLRHRIEELRAAQQRHRLAMYALEDDHAARRRMHERAASELEELIRPAVDEEGTLRRWYAEWLPRVPVARCPHSQRVVAYPIDTVDLNGWFWEHWLPSRPWHYQELPSTWLAMTGAMRLRKPLAVTSFEARPGPEVPYVIPRILDQREDVRAVIAEVPVGPHTGWAVTYFARVQLADTLVATWGESTYHWRSDDGRWNWEEGVWGTTDIGFDVLHNDYDLGPWLRSGRLLWIAPGDAGLALRSGDAGCPYVGLRGSHEMAYVSDGRVWRDRPKRGKARKRP
jgi:hypothetical protein